MKMKPSARISLLCRDLRKNARIKNRSQSRRFLQLESGQIGLITAMDGGGFILAMFCREEKLEGAVQKERTALIIFKDKRFVLC